MNRLNIYRVWAIVDVPDGTDDGYVIEAESTTQAREVAGNSVGGGGCLWTSPEQALCVLVGHGIEKRKNPRIILTSFYAG